jgi:ABC-type antimicrobial peptide transport system permease subunit
MDRWLDGFAYRITPGLGTALAAASLAVGIGWLTVAWQALRAANLDPVRSLRYE